MHRAWFTPILLLALASVLPHAMSATAKQLHWQGNSAGFSVNWSSDDLSAVDEKTGATLLSAKDHSQANFDRIKKTLQPGQIYEEDYELLSLVGPILSLEYHARISSPSNSAPTGKSTSVAGVTRYVAVDLRDPAASVARLSIDAEEQGEEAHVAKLSDVFAEKDVVSAFNNDIIIQSTIDTSKVSSVQDLVKALHGKHLPPPDMCGRFDWNLLNEFGVHHLRGNKAAVRLGVSGSDPKPEQLSELGMVFPIPAAWQPKFLLASEGKEGVLMGALKKKAGKARTHFEFKMDKKH